MSQKFDIELSLENTLSIYFQGPEVWNKFVEDNRRVYFNFKNVPWEAHGLHLDFLNQRRGVEGNIVSFKGYKFKAGVIDFSGTDFGERGIDFSEIDLNETALILVDTRCCGSLVNLSNIQIRKGDLNLKGSQLGTKDKSTNLIANGISISEGNVNCSDLVVKNGTLNFSYLKVLNGDVDFSGSVFRVTEFGFSNVQIKGKKVIFDSSFLGEGYKYFGNSKFEVQKLSFQNVNFGTGSVDFQSCNFSTVTELVDFKLAKLKGYTSLFSGVDFSNSNADFSYAMFDCRVTDFIDSNFSNAELNFYGCEFVGRVAYSQSSTTQSIAKRFSFRKSIFHSTLDLGNIKTASIIDLLETKLSAHTTLDNLTAPLSRKKIFKFIPGIYKSTSKDDALKLRRLKEIAETNKNHTAALRFHAAEMRARRWHDMPKLASILDAAFSMLSNYGQSILRPFGAWLIVVIGCGAVYSGAVPKLLSGQSLPEIYTNSAFLDGTLYSLIQTLPVFPISRVLQQDLYSALSSFSSPDLMIALTIFQNLLGVVFLFLIGLGLRNRFRL